jgi:hypothetical protein
LSKDYAKLKKETVYLRRGTSTAIANPDEIAMMGSADETQITTPARPWVIIDGYSSAYLEDEETGEEYLVESIHIVNRGQVAAVSINPDIHLAHDKVHIVGPLPTLGPGEGIDAKIQNLRETLDRARASMGDKLRQPLREGSSLIKLLPLHLPLVIEYRSLDHNHWTTEHTISCTGYKIGFTMAHPNEPQEWTELPILE